MTHTGHILLETYVIEYGRSPADYDFLLGANLRSKSRLRGFK